jgi:hypothetical protein
VIRRRGEHAFEQLAVASLQLVLLGQRLARIRHPLRECVAGALELCQPRDPGLGKVRRNSRVQLEPRERLGRETRQLVLQAADLTAQLNACEALVTSHSMRSEHVPIEQIWHRPAIECNRPVLSRKRCAG